MKRVHPLHSGLPHSGFARLTPSRPSCGLDRTGYFLLFIFYPSTAKAQNNVDDYLDGGNRHHRNLIRTHSCCLLSSVIRPCGRSSSEAIRPCHGCEYSIQHGRGICKGDGSLRWPQVPQPPVLSALRCNRTTIQGVIVVRLQVNRGTISPKGAGSPFGACRILRPFCSLILK